MLLIEPATPDDAPHIHRFITQLAIYEREPDAVKVSVQTLARQLSESPPPFESLVARVEGETVGFALFFHNYSTWRGRRGLYLEDLYVQPSHRGRGIGRALLAHLAKLAVDRDCARFEWSVLDWNAPAIALYEALGAVPRRGWTLYQLTDEALMALAAEALPRV